jgi:hypothetical protein
MATKSPMSDPRNPVVDPMIDPITGEYAVIAPGHNFKSVTQKIAGIVLTSNTPLGWFFGLIVGAGVATGVAIGITWLFLKGVGIWGVTIPGAWGFAIINFVWWIGIGHAGTLISAILLLFKQTWRNSINRFAEAMTIFAVVCAGTFPLIHVGRPWLAYWLFDVRDDLDCVLVCGNDSGLRHPARPGYDAAGEILLRPAFAGLARLDAALDAV